MSELNTRLAATFAKLKEQKPLIHHITNFVVMNDTANVTLHLGALPVMAHAAEEVANMASVADALVLNLGTLTPTWVESMRLAGQAANRAGRPVVLDPVGAGATPFRTATAKQLMADLAVAVVRGNAGEIGALMGRGGEVRGVESTGTLEDPATVARDAARAWGAVVAITGKRDFVSDGERVLSIENGHKWLTTLTGTGCMATTAIACFAAVEDDVLIAVAGALAGYGLAAERAAERASGPASFKIAFFDELYALTPTDIEKDAKAALADPSGIDGFLDPSLSERSHVAQYPASTLCEREG
jgi:hydroxyethylthiazole kinase